MLNNNDRSVPIREWLGRLVIAGLIVVVSGCAQNAKKDPSEQAGPYEKLDTSEPSVVAYDDYEDPLEPVNRVIFNFNDFTYRYALSPLSKGYQWLVPKPVNTSISNFFYNIREPIYSINNLFQAKPGKAGTSLLRLGINSTLGLLGLFDPAKHWWGIEREETNFGDTLAFYGAGYGAYIVLPLLGPSDLRDGTSKVAGYLTYPLTYVRDSDNHLLYLQIYEAFHNQSPTLERYPQVIDPVEDPYQFTRNLYLQNVMRDADVVEPGVEPGSNSDESTDAAEGS